jgi:menaquinone-9 beta-reductase
VIPPGQGYGGQGDVIVVGAGPAGAVAALVLARAGVDVRLLERARFPRDKLCGDTLNPGSLAILDRLGIGDAVRAGARPVTGMIVTGPGASVSADYPRGLRGASMTRRELDQLLLNAALAAGARVEPGVTVRDPVLDEGTRVIGVRVAGRHDTVMRAPIVVAADGRGSRVAAALQLSSFARQPRRWAFGAYFTGVTGMTDRGEMHIRPDGYIGVAPLPGGLTNVAVVRETRRLPAPYTDQQAFVREVLTRDRQLRDRFADATQVSRVHVLGPLAVDAHAPGAPGLLLAGDAAGFVDPMTGDGLRFALRGGELAAQAALEELASGRPMYAALGAARRREFAAKWRVNRALRSLVGSPRLLNAAATVSRFWPSPVEYLIGVAGDVNLVGEETGETVASGDHTEQSRGTRGKRDIWITRG